MDFPFVKKDAIAKVLGLNSPDSVRHYQSKWIYGIHYYKPEGKTSAFQYNLRLIEHWQQCHRNIDNLDHARFMAEYQRSLNPLKRRRA